MNDFVKEEMKDHYPSSGMIQFMTGERQSFKKDTMNFIPEVGKFLIFPCLVETFSISFLC